MYDIVYIGPKNSEWKKIKGRFATAKHADSFEEARSKVFTKMFWIIWSDITILDDFDFSYQADNYSLDVIHVFRNSGYFDGICIMPRKKIPSNKELQYRFFMEKKEVDIVASKPKPYDKLFVQDYTDYIAKLQSANSDFVWIIPNDVEVNFDFEYNVPYWDKDIVHIFRNGKFHDGIMIHHKSKNISKKEYEFCWHQKKKEVDILASNPKPYDIVFISYDEPNADENYAKLLERFPRAKRIHGVKGIHRAHIEAAKLCETTMFWVVDGDAVIKDSFNFDYQVPAWQNDNVYVWRSQNSVNDLVYGYGGVKLLPKKQTIDMNTHNPDMTTSISSKFNIVNEISNITKFNTDPFNTWKSAFRECAKLSSKTIRGQINEETEQRLEIWKTVGHDKKFGKYAIAGALSGSKFGTSKNSNISLINDFEWLYERFQQDSV